MTEITPGLDLVVADCLDALRELDAESVDAICTDPPYGLEFMSKEWDSFGASRARVGRGGNTARDGVRGEWVSDRPQAYVAGSAFQGWTTEWAREALRVLKPGGHALVFGGTRTYHRLACGLEDAGFEIRDCLAWMYGSGFPKSLDVAKAIDKAQGVEGQWRQEDHPGRGGSRQGARADGTAGPRLGQGFHDANPENPDGLRHIYEPSSDVAREWSGWGTALKPAFEPIVVARKPLIGTVAGNVLAHGVGGLNVDACRIEFAGPADEEESKEKNQHADFESGPMEGNTVLGGDWPDRPNYDPPGRWPANVLLGHSPDCVPVGTHEVASDDHYPAARPGGVEIGTVGHAGQDGLEERSTRGETVEVWDCVPDCPVRLLDEQTGELHSQDPSTRRGSTTEGMFGTRTPSANYDDRGGASRFFYVAKVSRAERNAGLDGFDPRPLHWSSGDANPGSFQGEGTDKTARNAHPTVKPVALMRWLIRLVTPPGGLVLDPFAGSGSTGCAAALEGARFLGIERDPDYAKIAEARIRFWAEHGDEALRVVAGREASERAREAVAASGQLDLLGGP